MLPATRYIQIMVTTPLASVMTPAMLWTALNGASASRNSSSVRSPARKSEASPAIPMLNSVVITVAAATIAVRTTIALESPPTRFSATYGVGFEAYAT